MAPRPVHRLTRGCAAREDVEHPPFINMFSPTHLGLAPRDGLYRRDARVRALIPFTWSDS